MRLLTVALLAVTAAACRGRSTTTIVVEPATPRTVSIDAEVYDPVTNFVWENVNVRIVEAEQEWSGQVFRSPYVDDWQLSDENGLVFFDAVALAQAEVGFIVDSGRAVLEPDRDMDQAYVTLEVWADGFAPVLYEVELSWDVPDIVISLPFEEPLEASVSAPSSD